MATNGRFARLVTGVAKDLILKVVLLHIESDARQRQQETGAGGRKTRIIRPNLH